MKPWLTALAAVTLLRLIVAAAAPLSPDEAYYWVWSRALAPGYLDHPPMVALWIRIGTLVAGDTTFGIRLLAPISAALGTLMLAQAAAILVPGRGAAVNAPLLLNATLLFGVGAVTMTPDTPLLFFWTATLWALAGLLRDGRGIWLIAAGAFGGLGLASKYTAAFLGIGVVLWLVVTPSLRRWFARPELWIGGLAAAVAFMPVVLWNAAHQWASFIKQGGRTGDWVPARAIRYLSELLGSQLGLATPLTFLICAAGIVLALRLAWRDREPRWTLLAALTIPPVLVFVQHAFGDRVQGNWPAIIYPGAAVAGAGLTHRFWLRLRAPAVALGAVMTALVYVQATLSPLPLSPRIDPITRLLLGWPDLAGQVSEAARNENARFVAADDYGIAAELARTVRDLQLIGVEPRWAFFNLPRAVLAGQTGLLVRSMKRGDDVDRGAWSSVDEIGRIARTGNNGVSAEEYRLYRVTGKDGSVAVVLPKPE